MSVYCVSYLSGKIGQFRTDNDSPITDNEKLQNYSLRPILFDYISYRNISTVSCSSWTNYVRRIILERWATLWPQIPCVKRKLLVSLLLFTVVRKGSLYFVLSISIVVNYGLILIYFSHDSIHIWSQSTNISI